MFLSAYFYGCRRDSFITHRAFCDALAEESARAITVNPFLSSQQPGSTASHLINLQPLSVKREQESHHLFNPRGSDNITPWLACPPVGETGPGPPQINLSSQLFPTTLDQSFLQNENPSSKHNPPLPPFQPSVSPHMSATALLQKAAQMGVTMSKPSPSPATMLKTHQAHMSENVGFSSTLIATSTAGSGQVLSSREDIGSGFGYGLASFENKAVVSSGIMEQIAASAAGAGGGPSLVHDMMSYLSSAGGLIDGSSSFDDQDFNGMLNSKRDSSNFHEILSKSTVSQFSKIDHENKAATGTNEGGRGGGNDGLTRDFLGLKAFPHKNFVNIAALDHINSSDYGQRNQNQPPWQG